MAILQGSAVEGVLGFETAYGVPALDGFKIAFHPGLVAGSDKPINKTGEITGDRSPQRGFLGFENGVFSGTFRVDEKQYPLFLQGVFGDAVSTDNLDGTYSHVFKIGDNVPSLFFEQNHTDAAGGLFYMTTGIGLNTMSLQFDGDDELIVSIEGVAKTTDDPTATTAVTGTIADFSVGTKFTKFQSDITTSMGAGVKVSGLSLDFTNNIVADESRYMDGTGQINGIPAGVAGVSGTFSALFEDNTVFAQAKSFTSVSITNTITNGLIAPNTKSIVYEMQEADFAVKSSPDITTDTALKVDALAYEAYHQSGLNASALTITVMNSNPTPTT